MKSLTDRRGVRLPFVTTAIHEDYPARIKLDTNTESKLSKNYLEDVLCTFHGLAEQWKNSNMETD